MRGIRGITWKEYWKTCWWSWVAAGIFTTLILISGLALALLLGSVIILAVILIIVCPAIFFSMVITEKCRIKIHSCGKQFSVAICPNCGRVCAHCGKKVEE